MQTSFENNINIKSITFSTHFLIRLKYNSYILRLRTHYFVS